MECRCGVKIGDFDGPADERGQRRKVNMGRERMQSCSGQELSEDGEELLRNGQALKEAVRSLDAYPGGHSQCAPTWEMVGDGKNLKGRSAAEGYRDPDLKDCNVHVSGCVRFHRRVLSIVAL